MSLYIKNLLIAILERRSLIFLFFIECRSLPWYETYKGALIGGGIFVAACVMIIVPTVAGVVLSRNPEGSIHLTTNYYIYTNFFQYRIQRIILLQQKLSGGLSIIRLPIIIPLIMVL